jgi:hypothetical protein
VEAALLPSGGALPSFSGVLPSSREALSTSVDDVLQTGEGRTTSEGALLPTRDEAPRAEFGAPYATSLGTGEVGGVS